MSIELPEYLYHGTSTKYLHIMKNKVANSNYWKVGTDFGKGLYTSDKSKVVAKYKD